MAVVLDVGDTVAVALAVGELEKVYPVDMEGVGVGVGVLEADGGWPQMRTLSNDRKAFAEVATATAVMRQHREATPCAAAGSTGVIWPGNEVPRGVSEMTGPVAVNGPAEPAVE